MSSSAITILSNQMNQIFRLTGTKFHAPKFLPRFDDGRARLNKVSHCIAELTTPQHYLSKLRAGSYTRNRCIKSCSSLPFFAQPCHIPDRWSPLRTLFTKETLSLSSRHGAAFLRQNHTLPPNTGKVRHSIRQVHQLPLYY